MTKEEKDLLLKDLCARLPYGVKILHEGWSYEWDDELSTVERVVGIDNEFIYTKVIDIHNGEEYRDDKWPVDTFDDKLFLRPLQSMTEEEKKELFEAIDKDMNLLEETLDKKPLFTYRNSNYMGNPIHYELDFLISHHFDYRGLIPKGLAIDCTNLNIY